jgi:hypothetical protein
MAKLSFYRQMRQDGGLRTAITTEDDHLLHLFQRGKKPDDPALLWYVDIRCQGARLPTEPEPARQWFLDQAPIILEALTQLAEKLQAGMDIQAWPLLWDSPRHPRGVRLTIACSAVRRTPSLEIASILTDLRDHWREIIRGLPAPQPAPS